MCASMRYPGPCKQSSSDVVTSYWNRGLWVSSYTFMGMSALRVVFTGAAREPAQVQGMQAHRSLHWMSGGVLQCPVCTCPRTKKQTLYHTDIEVFPASSFPTELHRFRAIQEIGWSVCLPAVRTNDLDIWNDHRTIIQHLVKHKTPEPHGSVQDEKILLDDLAIWMLPLCRSCGKLKLTHKHWQWRHTFVGCVLLHTGFDPSELTLVCLLQLSLPLHSQKRLRIQPIHTSSILQRPFKNSLVNVQRGVAIVRQNRGGQPHHPCRLLVCPECSQLHHR